MSSRRLSHIPAIMWLSAVRRNRVTDYNDCIMQSVAKYIVATLLGASFAMHAYAVALHPDWLLLPAMLAGWFVADGCSGLVHMVMDYRPCPPGTGLSKLYFYPGSRESDDYQIMLRSTMAKIGPLDRLTYDFKNHHPRPDALGRRSLWRQIGSTVCVAILPASLALNAAWYWLDLPGTWMAFGWALLVGGAFAQYFHGTLHRDDNILLVHLLRRIGLLMTPERHRRHHETLQRDFSTNCGWSNPLLNIVFRMGRRYGFFRDEGLEPQS